jgi:hypothetical protein
MRDRTFAALAWGSARKHEWDALERTRERVGLEWGIVKSVERSLGRTARPCRLDLRLLPVAGSYAWRHSVNRALLSLRCIGIELHIETGSRRLLRNPPNGRKLNAPEVTDDSVIPSVRESPNPTLRELPPRN